MISTPLISPQRDRFDLPRDTCYLNAAYMGPMPKSAIAAGQVFPVLKRTLGFGETCLKVKVGDADVAAARPEIKAA